MEESYEAPNGDYELAAKRFLNQLKRGNSVYFDVVDYEGIADYFIDFDQLSRALKVLNYGLSQHPSSTTLHVKKAMVMFNNGNIKGAMNIAKECALLEPTNNEIFYLLGSGYVAYGNRKKAEECFSKIEQTIEDSREDIYFNIGSSWEQGGEYNLAIKYFKKSLKFNPEDYSAYYDLGFCYDKIGKLDESIANYTKYLDFDPFNEAAWFNLGIVYSRYDMVEKALEAYEYSLALNEDYISALFNKANLLANTGKYEEAIGCYLEYLEKDQDCEEAWGYISDCLYFLEDYDAAYLFLQKALNKKFDDDIEVLEKKDESTKENINE